MSLEQLIEEARRKRPPEEQARLDAEHRKRMEALDRRLSKEFRDSIVTQEQLNRVIDYGIRYP